MNKSEFFYFEYSSDIEPKISYKKCTEFDKLFKTKTKIFEEYDNLKQKIKKERKTNEQIVIYEEKEAKLSLRKSDFSRIVPYWKLYPYIFFNKLDININKDIPIIKELIDDSTKIKKNQQFKGLHSVSIPHDIYKYFLNKDSNYITIAKDMYKYYLNMLYYLFEHLELGGRYTISLFNYIDSKYIEYIYLLSLMFKKIVIYKTLNNLFICCFDFLKQQRISILDFKKISENKNFCIEPKPELELLGNFIISNVKEEYQIQKLLLDGKYNDFLKKAFEKHLKFYIDLSSDYESIQYITKISNTDKILINDVIKMYIKYKKNEINGVEKILKELKNKMNRFHILEIGMGMGVFSKIIYNYMEKNLDFSKLIIIDQHQKIIWDDTAVKNLKKNTKNMIIYEESPIIALPKVLNDYYNNTFGLIFIHSFDTFDKMIYQLIFINLLIKENGYLIIDKSAFYHVQKFISFIENNYPFYVKIKNNNNLIIFKNDKKKYYELKNKNFNPF